MYYYDSTYILVLIGFAISMWAQWRVSSTYAKYAEVRALSGITGAELSRHLLQDGGVTEVSLARVAGKLTDNFNPKEMTVNLSSDVYEGTSISALGVAAHEIGHVLQYRDNYTPLMMRSALVPVAQIGSYAAVPLLILGLVMSWQPLVTIGIAVFTVVVAFYLVTLPVEFNASKRALILLQDGEYLTQDELGGARAVLGAAGMTYVAAALQAMLTLLRLVLLSSRRRN